MYSLTPLGVTDFRNSQQLFGIKDVDRLAHIYALGKTGVGKSTLILNMIRSDIARGNNFCLIDPHGDVAEKVLDGIPFNRIHDVIYFNPKDLDYPIAFNPLAGVAPNQQYLVASNLVSTFKNIWQASWGVRMEYILKYCILTLLQYPVATLLDIQPLLTDSYFRHTVLSYVTDPYILSFWHNEFDKYPPALKAEAITPILNKTGVFVASVPLRHIVGQRDSGFTIQDVMDTGKILIANLSKGELGEDAAAILGSTLVTAIQLGALHRSTQAEEERKPFYLFVDEVQSFVSLSFVSILAEARKYKLGLFLTHQYIDQLDEDIQSAIFGNVGTMISFRVGAEDAKYLEPEFSPVFVQSDLVSLPRYSMYIKLMIDGATSKPFSARTVQPEDIQYHFKHAIIAHSRKIYAKPREEIEQCILARHNRIQPEERQHTLFTN